MGIYVCSVLFSQYTYLKTTLGEIQFQIHHSKDFANMLPESTYDKNTPPIKLKTNYEYYIDITPFGQVSLEQFKTLDIQQRRNSDHFTQFLYYSLIGGLSELNSLNQIYLTDYWIRCN